MQRAIVLASRNQGKIKEFRALLAPLGLQLISLLDLPDVPDIVEDGDTFFANARLKAETVCKATGLPTLADDSGLVVHYLGGAPGVHSARFAWPEKGDGANNAKLLRILADVPEYKRQAHFTAVIALAMPDSETQFATGRCFGLIANEPRGEQGFGYDPLFYIPELGKTMAEIEPTIKNQLSHRAKAMRHMLLLLRSSLSCVQ
ncbi:MAG: XTP/dITP diphosphatase [Firmicutes bacterium]|nr:XTP/dITP diphosphatase [Bacillota bacterium]